MKLISVVARGGILALLVLTFVSCTTRQTKQKGQGSSKKNLVTLRCSYTGLFSKMDPPSKTQSSGSVQFQFNREKSQITKIEGDYLQDIKAVVSPDKIMFSSVRDKGAIFYIMDHQIDRKTLAYKEFGIGKEPYSDSEFLKQMSATWDYIGKCEEIEANTEGNKI
jgi:hypothetical protein